MSQNTKYTVIALTVIALLLISGTVFVVRNISSTSSGRYSDSVMLNLPTISTRLSASDGESHEVELKITLEIPADNVNDTDANFLRRVVTEAVSNLNYDKITEPGNITYIQDEVQAKLKEQAPNDAVLGIYVPEIQAGDYRFALPSNDGVPGSDAQQQDAARKLFDGIN
ncbi:MAG: hypothetical protein LBS21_07175 [Clostridiales bacterium]|jgi:hypothetical protein|nr:hypothetical protein [Clostridiales bacterium]